MKNQSGAIKTNLELYRVVMGGSGGYRRLPGGSDHFLWQTDTHTLHHNIYILMIFMITTTTTGVSIQKGSSWTWIDGLDLFATGDERFPVTKGWQTQISRQCPLVIVVNREVHFWWQPPTSDFDDSFADMRYMVLDKLVMLISLWCWQICDVDKLVMLTSLWCWQLCDVDKFVMLISLRCWQICDVDKLVMLTSLWCLKASNANTTVQTCYVTPLASFSTSIKVKENFFAT